VQYVNFRLARAGAKREIFTRDAFEEIHRQTKGVPRRVNNLCDMSLLIGYGMKAETIDAVVIREAIDDTAMPDSEPGEAVAGRAEPEKEVAKPGN
jgi:general secretion pathway protein A